MKNNSKYSLLLFFFILTGCSEVSEEAEKAGFKSDTDYQNHLEKLRIKNDSLFKEKILLASNIASFDSDNQYEVAVAQLEKSRRKYISENGINFKLLNASSKVISLNNEFEDYKNNKKKILEDQFTCINEVGEEPLESDYGSGSYSYELVKTSWDIQIMLCNIETNTYGVSNEFILSHTAARKLVNSSIQTYSKEDAEILFNKFLLDLLNESK